MHWTSEHEQIRRTIRQFVESEVNPNVEEWESHPPMPLKKIFKKMGALGLLGMNKPEKFGGLDLDYSYNLLLAEELGACSHGSLPMAVGVQIDMATPALARYGSDELRAEFLSPAIAGDSVACIGVSEAGAGSDVASLQTQARSQGDDYVISGSKMWITNGAQADFMCLLANTSDNPVHKNKSLIIVPMNLKGISHSQPFDKVGMRASDTVQVFFDQVRVPKRFRIGEENRGFKIQMEQFTDERLYAAASTLKRLETNIAMTAEYCAQREAFGRPLLDNQWIQFRLAEMQTEVETLRALTYRACDLHIQNDKQAALMAAMAKLKAGRLSRTVVDGCLQFWGGMGFMNENPVARSFRDGRVLSIGGGADEVMLSIIAKHYRFASGSMN